MDASPYSARRPTGPSNSTGGLRVDSHSVGPSVVDDERCRTACLSTDLARFPPISTDKAPAPMAGEGSQEASRTGRGQSAAEDRLPGPRRAEEEVITGDSLVEGLHSASASGRGRKAEERVRRAALIPRGKRQRKNPGPSGPGLTRRPHRRGATCGNRTHDLFITSESLCRLS